MARIICFDPTQPRVLPVYHRYPRFEEVQAEIENTAIARLGAGTGLGEACRLMQRLRDTSSSDARGLIDRLDDVLITVRKQHEHAAYIVGLRAGTFRLENPPLELPDERRPAVDPPSGE